MIDFGYGVRLGPLDSKYQERIRSWRNDERVWKWCRQNDVIDDMSQVAWFKRQSEDRSLKMWAVMNGDEIVGVAGLTSIDATNRRGEFSLYIAPESHRNGFGTKTLKTMFQHGFYNLGLNCIWGETFAGNPAAGVFKGVGMKKEGTRRDFYYRSGRFIDCHLYSLLRSEFDLLLPTWKAGCTYPRPDVAVTAHGGPSPEASLRPFDLSTWECKEKTARA